MIANYFLFLVFLVITVIYFIAMLDVDRRKKDESVKCILTDYFVGLSFIGLTLYFGCKSWVDLVAGSFL